MNEADHATGPGAGYGPPPPPQPELRRLYREPEEKRVAGVCGGLADYFGIDPTLVRLAVVLLTLTTGVVLFVYLIAAVIVPERPPGVARRAVPPPDAGRWSNGTKVLIGLAAIALIGFDDIHWFRWWFNAPMVAIALVGLGVWLLVAERDRPDGELLGAPPTESDDFPPPSNAWSVGSTTLPTDAEPVDGVAGGIDAVAGGPTTGTVGDQTDAGGPVTSAAGPVVDDGAPGAGPQGEASPPIPPWGVESPWWSGPSGPSAYSGPSAPSDFSGPMGPSTMPQSVATREPKRGGAGLPLGVIGLLFVGAGVLSLFAVLDVVDIGPVDALAAGLLLIGVAMIVGAWRGNGRPLIALGLPLVGLLLLAGLVDVPLGAGAGDRTRVIDTVAGLDRTQQLTAGELTLDLRDLPLGPRGRPAPELRAEVGFGELIVIVPEAADVAVDADVGIGDVVGDHDGTEDESGVNVREQFDIESDEAEGRLALDLHVGIGEIVVRRA